MKRAVAIIGAGQAGSAIAHGLRRAGHKIAAVASRAGESAASLAAEVDARPASPDECVASADLIFVTTSDDAIGEVVAGIAPGLGPRHAVVHCSGVLGLDVLDPASLAGASVGILHPVTPLVPPEDPATLDGKPMGVESRGDEAWLLEVVADLGGRPVELAGVDRTLYHAGAVMGANLVVAMSATAEAVLVAAGVAEEDARTMVASLLISTARNVAGAGVKAALTGPVRRGDADVIRRHRESLATLDPELAETYRLVSRRILALIDDPRAKDASEAALEPAGVRRPGAEVDI